MPSFALNCYTVAMRNQFSPPHLAVFVLLLVLLMVVIQLELISIVFAKLGLSYGQGMLLLFASLFGSVINLPLFSVKAEKPEIDPAQQSLRSLLRLPEMPFTGKTIVAVNFGGCLVPLVFSLSLISRFPLELPALLLAIAITSTICYAASRPVPGMGIGMPILVAPITAAVVALMLGGETASPLAYVAGTLGVLIGADLLRLRDIGKIGAPIASIGGAGTFDGIFLTGIVAVLLT